MNSRTELSSRAGLAHRAMARAERFIERFGAVGESSRRLSLEVDNTQRTLQMIGRAGRLRNRGPMDRPGGDGESVEASEFGATSRPGIQVLQSSHSVSGAGLTPSLLEGRADRYGESLAGIVEAGARAIERWSKSMAAASVARNHRVTPTAYGTAVRRRARTADGIGALRRAAGLALPSILLPDGLSLDGAYGAALRRAAAHRRSSGIARLDQSAAGDRPPNTTRAARIAEIRRRNTIDVRIRSAATNPQTELGMMAIERSRVASVMRGRAATSEAAGGRPRSIAAMAHAAARNALPLASYAFAEHAISGGRNVQGEGESSGDRWGSDGGGSVRGAEWAARQHNHAGSYNSAPKSPSMIEAGHAREPFGRQQVPLIVNYSPTVTIADAPAAEIERRLVETIGRHGSDLVRVISQELAKRQRAEF